MQFIIQDPQGRPTVVSKEAYLTFAKACGITDPADPQLETFSTPDGSGHVQYEKPTELPVFDKLAQEPETEE